MKQFFLILLPLLVIFNSCEDKKNISSTNPINWSNKVVDFKLKDSLVSGTTYLSVYSQIYSQTEELTHDLTATISIRNTSITDTVYIAKADYYSTQGKLIRTYFEKPIFLTPLETAEIVIDEKDREGGTGANFIFEWKTSPSSSEPFFEGIMIATSGQKRISFTTQGRRIK